MRFLKGEVVAITGSNGKTTTTTLVGEILKAAGRPTLVGGNIGRPVIGDGGGEYGGELERAGGFELSVGDGGEVSSEDCAGAEYYAGPSGSAWNF